jgi:hypothetical protein
MRSFVVLSIALAFAILLATEAKGQIGAASIAVNGQVSEAVFVSIAPGAGLSNESLSIIYSNLDKQTIRLSISTSGSDTGGRITIPLQLRSNAGYTLSALANSNATWLGGLCIAGVRATGRHVARAAVNATNMAACAEETASVQTRNANRSTWKFSSPSTLLQGPLISLSGTPDSPFNALEVLLVLEVGAQVRQPQGSIELILSATPARAASAVLK